MPSETSAVCDLTHHISKRTLQRGPSPLKSTLPFMALPGMLSLGGGLPHPSTFPIEEVSFKVQNRGAQALAAKTGSTEPVDEFITVTVGKQPRPDGENQLPLASGLQYGNGYGQPAFHCTMRKFVERYSAPPYANWEIVATAGNTDGIARALELLTNQGDGILLDEWAYPAVVELLPCHELTAVGVKIDSEGMIPEELRRATQEWNAQHPQEHRLRVLYIVPTAQNPTGATMSAQRRAELYAVAQELDLVIIEDDPYGPLQFFDYPDGPDGLPGTRGLIPTISSIDVDGRVVRLDCFSKVLAPGLRCGIVTASKDFSTYLCRIGEATVQQTAGFSQVLVVELLERAWGFAGWEHHILELQRAYRRRCDTMMAAVDKYLVPDNLVSYSVPTAGMFLWMKVSLPQDLQDKPGVMKQIWDACIEERVLLIFGYMFAADGSSEEGRLAAADAPYLRVSFSFVPEDQIDEGIHRLANVLRRFRCGTSASSN